MLQMLSWMARMQSFLVPRLCVDYTLLSVFPLWAKFVLSQRRSLIKICISRRLSNLSGSL
nr:hypothetical protein Iba_scaffold29910CG0210 [Ipomoea batatas]GME01980.1 hypothetical protein Iba_scaffold624824CG0010 [Ipomoea batatas]